ncbi:hypothetical protein [Streptomyces sp. Ac-502]|uniref:hypothetical protein n=1 Tax=Streptomyces sp. Ac-502 TaxID=3342801 RepID=UPI003862352F
MKDTASELTKRKRKLPADRKRVTADLPLRDYTLLDEARDVFNASTTELTRAFLRLQHDRPDLAELVSKELSKLRIEAAEAKLHAVKQGLAA